MARHRSERETRELTHVLVCGGSFEDWRMLSTEGWSRLVDVLTSALQSSGARWLTLCPYADGSDNGDRSDVLERIALAVGGTKSGNRVSFIGRGGIVGIVDVRADGRERFVDAVNAIPSNSLDEGMIAASLYAPATDDPDLILVFGNPTRVPLALVWELAYGELVFLDTPWAVCDVEHVHMAVDDFQRRDRRFGGVDS
jgi:undecaprenyl pyrophosphate synthase